MPMDPMDVMWMSKAPTVSELVGNSNVTFKPVVGSHVEDKGIRPDYDTDVLWKQKKETQRQRTMSLSSSDSERPSTGVLHGNAPRPRRISISEMIFGTSPSGRFGWGQSSIRESPDVERKGSITEDERFKELLKHQTKILGDDGVCSFGEERLHEVIFKSLSQFPLFCCTYAHGAMLSKEESSWVLGALVCCKPSDNGIREMRCLYYWGVPFLFCTY
ncbi:hypothetical protein KIN20_035096 [Parelaphostrongylus tenuis]|uniref:Uncharacterized protein n=1 Tax=Parelaphostrongylus tenuis TaxID=148309 RepID=A0AAD5WKJ0_PARTN|nr:hypothetical protein KIN20_035096 [Parelaphostrongylus tenuis]